MYLYNSKLVRVVDGDTIDGMIDLGFHVWIKKRIRLAGINAYECRTRDKEEKVRGLLAKAWLTQHLKEYDDMFELMSVGVGKFGRCLGYIYTGDTSGVINGSVNMRLIREGHATLYED